MARRSLQTYTPAKSRRITPIFKKPPLTRWFCLYATGAAGVSGVAGVAGVPGVAGVTGVVVSSDISLPFAFVPYPRQEELNC